MRAPIYKIGRKCTAHGIQPAVGEFGLKNSRGAGADENPHALRAVFVGCSSDGSRKAILHQTRQGKPVVAAIKIGKMRRQFYRIQPGDFAGKSCKIDGIEGAWRKPRTLRPQCVERGSQSATQAAGRGEVGEPEWIRSQTR